MWSWAVMDKKWEWPLTLSFPLPLLPSSSISPLYSTLLSPIYSSCSSGFIGFFLPSCLFSFLFCIPSVLFVCLNYRIIIIQLGFHQRGIIMTSCHRHRQGSILLGVKDLQSNLDVWHGSYQCLLPSSFGFLCLHVLPIATKTWYWLFHCRHDWFVIYT